MLRPEPVPFISYPYEWCFGQFKAAALLTLAIQRRAIEHGMTLKDCTAYNVQFRDGRPVFIDTLSFEAYREGDPWVAYRQFCQHFLAPLALMSLTDVRLNQLSRTNIDGVPLDLAGRLLPLRSRLRPSLALHIHLHARLQSAYSGERARRPSAAASGPAGSAGGRCWGWSITSNRRSGGSAGSPGGRTGPTTTGRTPTPTPRWSGRSGSSARTSTGSGRRWPGTSAPTPAGSAGWPPRGGSRRSSFDIDPACVELNYREVVAPRRGPDPAAAARPDQPQPRAPAGRTASGPRSSSAGRSTPSWPWPWSTTWRSPTTSPCPASPSSSTGSAARLIIEFVPKGDPQVARLLAGRKDVFPDYHQARVRAMLSTLSSTSRRPEPIPDSGRVLYLMRGRGRRRDTTAMGPPPVPDRRLPDPVAVRAQRLRDGCPVARRRRSAWRWAATLVLWLLLWAASRDASGPPWPPRCSSSSFFAFNQRLASPRTRSLEDLSRFWVLREYNVHPPGHAGLLSAAAAPLSGPIFARLKDPGPSTTYLNTFALVLTVLPVAHRVPPG